MTTQLIAMHAPDGFLTGPIAIVTGIIALVVLGFAVRFSSEQLGDRQIPLAGLAAAFIFAAQMVNFPVAAGTSGHLLGGALAAILLGPWVGTLVVSVVVIVQALLFADGGISALGYNITNMAIVTAFGGWAMYQLLRKVLPANKAGVVGASALAGGASVVLAAAAFSIEWLFGASAPVPFDTVFGAMVGVHLLIGIGEGLITGAAVGAVLATRPELVTGARDLPQSALQDESRVSARVFALGALGVTAVTALVVSQFASSSPDGLERVAADKGFEQAATDHSLADSLFADYATAGIDNEALSLAIAGGVGVVLTLLIGYGVARAARFSPAARSAT